MLLVYQVSNEMSNREFFRQLFFRLFRPLTINELEEIEADGDTFDTNQIYDVLDVIDITVERALFFLRAHENGIYANHSAPFTDHLNLLVTDIALDVVIPSRVGM